MSPTISNGDLLLASKLDYRLHDPQRGDVVILKDPMDPAQDFIKRIIGLPGDRVLIRDHHVFVNGVRLEEPYLAAGWSMTSDWPDGLLTTEGEIVPANSYFVLGDNRDHSSDSRFFGYIDRSQLDGKAVVRFWPLNKAAVLDLRPTLAKEP